MTQAIQDVLEATERYWSMEDTDKESREEQDDIMGGKLSQYRHSNCAGVPGILPYYRKYSADTQVVMDSTYIIYQPLMSTNQITYMYSMSS